MKNNYSFGFDIGCASVGWAVLDDKIIELGSNIFSEANSENNKKRRERRGSRRLVRRRKNRIRDFKVKFWNKYVEPKLSNEKHEEIIKYLDEKFHMLLINVVELKNKGLNEKMNIDELYFVLLNYIKHKGISYIDDEIDKEVVEEDVDISKMSNYAKALYNNNNELKENLPCQIQSKRFQSYGSYRGDKIVTNGMNKISLSNVFTVSSYEKEIKLIFNEQKKYYEFINDNFEDDFIKLFKQKREYYVGPGNEKSRTDYGIYTTNKNEKGEYITDKNIFAKLVGKCSIYNENNGYKKSEFRASAASYTAEYYNLLSDLNNIKIDGESFTKEEKISIIDKIKNADKLNSNNIEKIFFEVKKIEKGIITGARIDKEGKNIYHCLECYRKMKKYFEKNDININELEIRKIDKICDILTINTEKDAIIRGLNESDGLKLKDEDGIELLLDNETINVLQRFRSKNPNLFNKWHNFSYKIMNKIIPIMLEYGYEQMRALYEIGAIKERNLELSDRAILSKKKITQEIYNPVVVRSVRVAIDILNALIKKYGYPKEVIIEMPRDKNTDEEKKRIKSIQSSNEKEIKQVIDIIKKDYGINITDENFRRQKNLVLKLKLWNEQQHKCIYSGKEIQIEDLLNDYSKFEIDHIIPISVSFDDSRQNKVLVYRNENQEKAKHGNRTAYEYIASGDGSIKLDEYIKLVKFIYAKDKNNKQKYLNLLFDCDIDKKEIREGFIARNLNDTRYASRIFLNGLQDYFRNKGLDTKVKIIRGSFTHQMRVSLGLNKDRNISFAHHAIDASLICYSKKGFNEYINLQNPYINADTGEILDYKRYKEVSTEKVYEDCLYQKKWKIIKQDLLDNEINVKFWHRVDRKANRKIADETIYGTRSIGDKIYKINSFDIRNDKDSKEKFKKYGENSLMFLYDKKTYDILFKIMNEYSNEKNPFLAYEKDTGLKICKYAKKADGAIVSKIKYLDGEVNKCIDISHKYGFKKGSKKIILSQLVPYRTDVYYNICSKKYKFVGVKQNTLKYDKGKLIIDKNAYEGLLFDYGILSIGQKYENLYDNNWEFRLSFYDNDVIEYEKTDRKTGVSESCIERHHSLNKNNVIETKPIYKKSFEKRNMVTITDTQSVRKVIVDILGKKTFITKEKFMIEI